MKKLLILISLPLILLYSQDDRQKNPNVELPDFVITGKDVISIKRAKKIEPDFVSTITESFIKPQHKPEELGLRQLSNPVKEELNLLDSTGYSKGSLSVNAGIYTLPDAKLNYNYPFENGMIRANVGGDYQRAYINNSGRYSVFGGAGLSYTTGLEDESVSGTTFFLGGDYTTSNYKLFASDNPAIERNKNVGNYYLGIQNLSGKTFIFDLKLNDYFTALSNQKFTDNLLDSKGFALLRFSDFGIGLKTNYQKQFYTNDSLDNAGFDFFSARPYISLEILSTLKAEVGYTFSNSGNQKFNNLYASFSLKLSRNLVLLGEFSPYAEFITSGKFLRKNDYFNAANFDNLFFRKSNYYNIVLKYEYGKYYQVDAGLKHYKSGDLPYFSGSDLSGQFDVATADAEEYNAYVNLLYHAGPYGLLYGSFDYFRVKDKSGRKLPYYPAFKANITYGYRFDIGLLAEILVDYNSGRYTNIQNTKRLNSFFNLGLKFTYTVKNSLIVKFEFQNLLNRDIFYWNGYKEKPIDVLAGFNYLFD
ncbi:hypothetical protein BMS3Abin03_01245 [bacterium BMS3Abin03]|nr:hypothetical protein BMS3Abin03_01245 [bacterium BMS3Abin03]